MDDQTDKIKKKRKKCIRKVITTPLDSKKERQSNKIKDKPERSRFAKKNRPKAENLNDEEIENAECYLQYRPKCERYIFKKTPSPVLIQKILHCIGIEDIEDFVLSNTEINERVLKQMNTLFRMSLLKEEIVDCMHPWLYKTIDEMTYNNVIYILRNVLKLIGYKLQYRRAYHHSKQYMAQTIQKIDITRKTRNVVIL